MKNLKLLGLSCLLSIYATTASAELLIDPTDKSSMGEGKVGIFGGMSTVGYDFGTKDKVYKFKRQYISGYYAYGFSKDIDVFIAGGYIKNTNLDGKGLNTSGDSGIMYGGGVRGGIVANKIRINWYGQYIVFDEELGSANELYNYYTYYNTQKTNYKSELNELSIGLTAVNTSHGITSYGGVEYIVLSDGKLSQTSTNFSQQDDIERYNKLVFRAGARKKIDNILFNINASLSDNSGSISIGASKKFQ